MSIDANDVFIQTPMMKELHRTIERWTYCGFTGGLILGDARLGKSWSIHALGNELLTAEGEPIKIFTVSIGERDVQTIRSTYVRIARCIDDKKISRYHTADIMEDNLFHSFSEAALCNRRRQIILIVDEAQWLSIGQFSVFAELFNDQDKAKNRLLVLFVANTQKFQPLAKLLLDQENEYLRERFFHNIYRFYGIRSFDELQACLQCFDNHMINPESSTSIVKHHCEGMTKSGYTLTNLAELIWSVYDERYAQPLQLNSWGMTYFQRAISILLMDYLPHYWRSDQETICALIDKSIAASGIVPSLKSVAELC